MRRLLPLLLAGAAFGADSATVKSPAPPAANPLLAPKRDDDRPAAPRRTRVISPEVAAALAAAAPTFASLPPPPPPPKPEDELPDARDLDKPKNDIVRLPKYLVREKKPAILTERTVYTEKGLIDYAMKRYITEVDRVLNRFRIPFLTQTNEARALAMFAEDERLQNMANLREAAAAASKSDPAQGTYILREAQKTYLRTSDFGWQKTGNAK